MIIRIISLCILIISLTASVSDAYSAYGSRGEEVYKLQMRLSELGYYNDVCDGVYGQETRLAVVAYQKDKMLVPDGIAGSKTLYSLDVISDEDIELLAMIINGESRGECYRGQVAVGAVVINRMNHPAFPDTLKGVVFQKGAFSAVNDGQIKLRVSDSCRKAAVDALNGADPTGGAVYYYNPETATCKWIRTRTVIKKIGNHLFCR